MNISVILLLTFLVFVEAQINTGYTECRWNIYKAKCLGEFVRLAQENVGLTAFPEITRAETCLQLKNNIIDRFPTDLNSLKNVVTLDVSHNRISALPNNLDGMGKLEILDVSHNRLASLSPHTRFPTSLRGLLLAGNGIKTIPAGFKIPSLFVLDLSQNLFMDIPQHFCVSNELIRMDFVDNPVNYDISRYIGTLNKCKNRHGIPFCLFTDHEYINCNCSVLGSVVFDRPSFLIGSSASNRAEMQCSSSEGQEEFSGRKLFDLDTLKISKQCNISAKQEGKSRKNNSNKHDAICMLTVFGAMLVTLTTLV